MTPYKVVNSISQYSHLQIISRPPHQPSHRNIFEILSPRACFKYYLHSENIYYMDRKIVDTTQRYARYILHVLQIKFSFQLLNNLKKTTFPKSEIPKDS